MHEYDEYMCKINEFYFDFEIKFCDEFVAEVPDAATAKKKGSLDRGR